MAIKKGEERRKEDRGNFLSFDVDCEKTFRFPASPKCHFKSNFSCPQSMDGHHKPDLPLPAL